MIILEKASAMLEKHPLCDHCLGRQFALLGYAMGNDERGKAIRTALTLEAHELALSGNNKGVLTLKTLAKTNFSKALEGILHRMKKRAPKNTLITSCFLCENKFDNVQSLARKALRLLADYEYSSFHVGVELPVTVEEREDEFKAEFDVTHGENLRNEFGRSIGKKIAEKSGKAVDFEKPDVVVLVNPFTENVHLQVNPLFVTGRYRKLARGIPQSKWFCSSCRGKGCEKCGWTGKMYPESVEEIVEKPLLDATGGIGGSFHASGREDIDARMLGRGRPFVVEITQPRKRFLDLKKISELVNEHGKDKVQVSNLKLANRDLVRRLKGGESAQKEYRVVVEFEKEVTARGLRLLEDKLANVLISQRTPIRVSHRRADLTREKYIYDIKVKKLSPRKAEMRIRCQGGLYVKELVTGDEGRTTPNVSEILNNRAKPMKLDVLNVLIGDRKRVGR
jgi:tRNA pseudouridine synthase 10